MSTGEFGAWLAFRADGGSVKELDHGSWGTAAVVRKTRYTPEGRESVAKLLARAPSLLRERDELREVLTALFEQCVMVHKHWGDGNNVKEADAAIDRARAVLSKVTP